MLNVSFLSKNNYEYLMFTTFITDSSKGVSETWVVRQRLEDLYKKLLLMDLEYALDKKVEQDLYVYILYILLVMGNRGGKINR